MYTLNSTATVVWRRLETNQKGLSLGEITDYLWSLCKPMNSISPEEIKRDIDEMLESLYRRGLIQKKKTHKSGAIYRIRNGILRVEDIPSTNDTTHEEQQRPTIPSADGILREIKLILTPALADRSLGITAVQQVAEINKHQSIRHTFLACLALVAYDIVLNTLGLSRLFRIIKRWPVKKNATISSTALKRISAGIERARIWYPKQVVCMQHSAVVCFLLRAHGLPAQLAIGGRQMPFKSHAWVEVSGLVVNDNQRVQNEYKVFAYY